MSIFRVTQDSESGYGYVYLADIPAGGVKSSVQLGGENSAEPDALSSLVLDFDAEGRLVGIEVVGRAERVLRPELLAVAQQI